MLPPPLCSSASLSQPHRLLCCITLCHTPDDHNGKAESIKQRMADYLAWLESCLAELVFDLTKHTTVDINPNVCFSRVSPAANASTLALGPRLAAF